jgi:cyanate permease
VRRVVLTLSGTTAAVSSVIYAASFLPLRAALLAWAVFGLASLALAAWLMSIEMPHDRDPIRAVRKKKK